MMREMTRQGLGATAVVEPDGRIAGIFTDGDLRRLIEEGADLRTLNGARGASRQTEDRARRRSRSRLPT